jgi:hypothetical protein
MTATEQNLSRPRASQANRVKWYEAFFGLFGGPLAWYLQLCAGYALASEPCFRGGDRITAPLSGLQWTASAMIAAMIAAVAVSLFALMVSWRVYRRARDEAPAGSAHVADAGTGRTPFLALWGVLLGGVFALAAAMTAVAFITLPRCAG